MTCNKCGCYHARLYDEHTDQHFCDDRCLLDWANDNVDVVLEYYRKLNVSEVD